MKINRLPPYGTTGSRIDEPTFGTWPVSIACLIRTADHHLWRTTTCAGLTASYFPLLPVISNASGTFSNPTSTWVIEKAENTSCSLFLFQVYNDSICILRFVGLQQDVGSIDKLLKDIV
jgi:hypothetical protein